MKIILNKYYVIKLYKNTSTPFAMGPGPFKTKSIRRSTEIELRTHRIVQNAQNSTANTMGLVPEPQTAKNISKNCQKVTPPV